MEIKGTYRKIRCWAKKAFGIEGTEDKIWLKLSLVPFSAKERSEKWRGRVSPKFWRNIFHLKYSEQSHVFVGVLSSQILSIFM